MCINSHECVQYNVDKCKWTHFKSQFSTMYPKVPTNNDKTRNR